MLIFSVGSSSLAIDFNWDGGAGDSLWNSVTVSGGVQTNWAPENIPLSGDNIILTGSSLAGPQTIDLEGGTQAISRLEANGVDGVYTFENGTLQLNLASGNALLSNQGGGELMIDADVVLNPNANSTILFQSTGTGDKVTVNGDVTNAQASGVTPLLLTARNLSLTPAVEVNGDISDGLGQIRLIAGFTGDLANHRGVVRVTGDNTFTGSVEINAVTLEFNSIANVGGGPNALGQPALADSEIRLGTTAENAGNSAGLRYVGTDPAGHTSDRVIRLGGDPNDSGVIEASGIGPLVLTGGVANPTNGQTLVLGGTNTGDNELSGTIQDPAGSGVTSLLKTGPGKWILSGSSPNLSNVFRANEGELVVTGTIGGGAGTIASLETLAAGAVTLEGGTITARGIRNAGALNFRSGVLNLSGANSTNGGSFTVGTDGDGALNLNSGDHAFENVTLAGNGDVVAITSGTGSFDRLDSSAGGTLNLTGGTLDLTDAAPGQGLIIGAGTIGSRIIGAGDVTKFGPGTVAVNLSTHTNSGKTNINAGILAVAPSARLSDATTVNVASGATLRFLTNSADSIFGLEGAGSVELGDAGLVLGNTGNSGGVGTFTGAISDGPAPAAGDLEKRGSGVFNFAGAATYSGTTTVTSGTMNVTGDITGASGVTIGAATLAVNGGTIDTPGNIRPTSSSAVFNLTGGLVKANAIDRTVNSQYLHQFNWTGGAVHLLTATAINGGATTAINRPFAGSLTLDDDMELIVDDTFSVTSTGVLNINGGSITADTIEAGSFSGGGGVSFLSGTMRMRNDQTFDAPRLAALDIDRPLGAGRSLVVDGETTLIGPLVLAAGSFSAGSIVGPENLVVAGGTLSVTASDLVIPAGESLDLTTGSTIDVIAGNVVVDGQLNAINAAINFTGDLVNNGSVNLINSSLGGSLTAAASASVTALGSNSFGGDLELTETSALLLSLRSGVDFDQVAVAGAATVDGVLAVSLADGFDPVAGRQFTVLSAASIVDEGLMLGGAAASQFDLVVNGTSIVLQATGGLAGDYNADGIVNAADYTVWRDGLGATFVQADYDVWANNFGATATATTPVPQPTAAVLAILACCGALHSRRIPATVAWQQ